MPNSMGANGARQSPPGTQQCALGTWGCGVIGSLGDGIDGDEQGLEGSCLGKE